MTEFSLNTLPFFPKRTANTFCFPAINLPGIDKDSYKLDGSVRVYYGSTLYIENSEVEFSGYQTIDFRDGKILAIWEWADYGGVSNQLNELMK